MNEEVDEHVPRRLAEQLVIAQKLLAQQPPAQGPARIGECEVGNSLLCHDAVAMSVPEGQRRSRSSPRRSFAGGQPMVLALGAENMVDEYAVERPAELAQDVGNVNVAVSRGRVTAWM